MGNALYKADFLFPAKRSHFNRQILTYDDDDDPKTHPP